MALTMKITLKNNTPTEVVLTIQAEAADLEPIRKHVLGHFATSVKVPGFREGKAPSYLIEKNINQQAFLDEFMEHALNDLYTRALRQEKLRTAASPQVELKKFVPYTTLDFQATVEVVGPITLPNYKTMKLAKKKLEITAKDINGVIETLLERNSERAEVKRAAKTGDETVIDFSGKDSKGEPVAGADGKDYPLILGSNTFIPGFEDHVIGMQPGETKAFTVAFPKDYGVAALQAKQVTFTVSLKKLNELQKSKLDDAFAAKVGPFKTVAELKADVKKQLTSERQWQADRDYENELIKKIAAKAKVEVPKSLIEEQVTRLEDEEKRNLAYRGQTWQEHLKAEGITAEEHRERHRGEATERVKAGLILSEISEKEGLDVSAEEIEIRLQILKSQYQDPAMLAELDKPENRQEVAARLLTEKTIAKLVDYTGK